MEVYVIRHTPVAITKDSCYGQSDVPLADTFLQDIAQFKNQLTINFDAVYCSPLQRCKDLAAVLAYKNVIYENALMEINFGDWENTNWNTINPNELNQWMEDFVNVSPPNGENLIALFERVKTFMDSLRKKQHSKVFLITHAGVIRCIWAYLLDIPLQNIFKIPVNYGQLMAFNLEADKQLDRIKSMS